MKIDPSKLGKQAPAPKAEDFLSEMFSPRTGAQQQELLIESLTPWRDKVYNRQPFRPYSQEKLHELAENIAQYGILSPILVRPYEAGYQILAGHNRVAAAKLAGLTAVPAIIRAVDDDTAALVLTDSNLYQREKLLPSEKAWAYRLRMETLKRQGKRVDLTSCQVGTKLRTDNAIAEETAESARTLQRFIRLTYLIDAFLDEVDLGNLPFTVGVSLSHLDTRQQQMVLDVSERNNIVKISLSQAEELKAFADQLNEQLIVRILGITQKQAPQRMLTIKIPAGLLPGKLPRGLAADEEFQRRFTELVNEFIAFNRDPKKRG